MPTASGTTVTPDDGYDALSSVGVYGDSNLVPSNVKKDVTIFGVTGTYGGGGGGGTGHLPLPVTGVSVGSVPYKRGKVKVGFIFPEVAGSVDMLIKKNAIPEDLEDYDQVVNLTSGETQEITINESTSGKYENKYGYWLVSKNEDGSQTALNYINNGMFNLLYAKGIIKEVENGSALPSYSNWTNRTIHVNRMDDRYLFFYNVYSSTTGGLYVIDIANSTITKISTSNIDWINQYKFDDTYLCFSSSAGHVGVFNTQTKTFSTSSSGNTNRYTWLKYKHFVFFSNSDTSCTTIVYDTQKKQFTNALAGGITYGLTSNDYGVFAYSRSSSSSSNVKNMYKFNETTGLFEEVLFKYGIDSPPESRMAYSATNVLYDSYGTFWIDVNGNDNPFVYDGTYFVTKGNTDAGTSNGFYGVSLFKMSGAYFYVKNGSLYKATGDNLKRITTGFTVNGSNVSLTSVKVFEIGEAKYIYGTHGSYTSLFKVDSDWNVTVIVGANSSANSISLGSVTRIDDNVFYCTGERTYILSGGSVSQVTSSAMLKNFEKLGNYIYAVNNNSTGNGAYVYKGSGNFISIANTTQRTRFYIRAGIVYIVQFYTYKNTGSELYMYRFDPSESSATVTGTSIRYDLGGGKYISTSNAKVYDIINGDEENVSMGGYTNFTYYDDAANNNYSSGTMVMNITSSNAIFLFAV